MFLSFVDQAWNFWSVSFIRRRLVSNIHPNTIFVSSMAPSASNFVIETISSRGMGSSFCRGRPTMWMASSAAALAFGRIEGSSFYC